MATNDYKNERIFLSYQWGSQQEVINLKQFLKNNGFDAWMDIHQLPEGSYLTEGITTAILHSDIFLACITKRYAESPMCRNEIHLANNNKKTIIPLYFEQLGDMDIQSIALLLPQLVRIEIFKDPNEKMDWTGSLSQQLIEAIRSSFKMTTSKIEKINIFDISILF